MPGLRVLVLDGGGSKGLFTLEMLQHIELCCGRPIRECFDLIVGTSVGALIAGSIASGISLQDMDSHWIGIASLLSKGTPTLTSLATRLTYGHVIDPTEWEKSLGGFFGETTLADLPESPRLLLLAADARTVIPHPYLIRNRPLPESVASRSRFETTSSMRLVDVFRAATAAPTVFPAHVVNGIPLVDGAILASNPVLFALAEANLLGSVECIVSLGTGISTRDLHPNPHRGVLAWTWATIRRSIEPETPEMLIQGLLEPSRYTRFDPPRLGDCDTWEADVGVLRRCRADVQTYMDGCQDALVDLVPKLCPEIPASEDNEDRSVSNAGRSGRPVSG
jgi:calcium-independent phospholipase A2-gamma